MAERIVAKSPLRLPRESGSFYRQRDIEPGGRLRSRGRGHGPQHDGARTPSKASTPSSPSGRRAGLGRHGASPTFRSASDGSRPLPRRLSSAHPRQRAHHRHGRRQPELEPAQLLRDEVSAGQRATASSRSIPARPARRSSARRSTPRCGDIPDNRRSTWSTSSATSAAAGRSSRTRSPSAPRWCGCSSASATTRRRRAPRPPASTSS